jgi:hypothetical protein
MVDIMWLASKLLMNYVLWDDKGSVSKNRVIPFVVYRGETTNSLGLGGSLVKVETSIEPYPP